MLCWFRFKFVCGWAFKGWVHFDDDWSEPISRLHSGYVPLREMVSLTQWIWPYNWNITNNSVEDVWARIQSSSLSQDSRMDPKFVNLCSPVSNNKNSDLEPVIFKCHLVGHHCPLHSSIEGVGPQNMSSFFTCASVPPHHHMCPHCHHFLHSPKTCADYLQIIIHLIFRMRSRGEIIWSTKTDVRIKCF